ncbi:type II toxin-antitoxin system VapB family antitoxin [Caldicellulosiruptor changbaiensis]|uniref:Type II toxin-antitoxin system VapB family antitoxin n=1 Tax=Caldicellulosiruptor changbaiensis TaxID=1222016 RepID=A0A3T0D6M3_9FIRM|nr:type II toxin-antitoxin system VapB family antitoxin [Caldicellulosiruptor changbaiensis]AZT90741.1 type II toxin-antitoxin system VapB family antitoxin [Caldicellulosiruptor changbaiensis]
MRTNIILNDELLKKAMKIAEVKTTKKEAVETALKEFVENHSRKKLSELRGKISFAEDYDYKEMRLNS